MAKRMLLVVLGLAGLLACGGNRQDRQTDRAETLAPAREAVEVPVFHADSAHAFVARQVAFGPRVPNTDAHRQCGDWLIETMQRFADTVYVQGMRLRAYNGTILHARNIIGVFHPERTARVLLCAHWDSRPWADHDPDPAHHYTPIDGANDGASGVGVLLEIARRLQAHDPGVGVDIVLFDAEDYGKHRLAPGHDADSWALGSQYWARNPHVSGYKAHYGILLDMVGARGATFKREGYSMMYAPHIVRKLWETAHRTGFGHFFPMRDGSYVVDDHYYVNKIRDIPTINIIHQDPHTSHGFFPQWHTREDTMEVIDPRSLRAVGQTVLQVLFEGR